MGMGDVLGVVERVLNLDLGAMFFIWGLICLCMILWSTCLGGLFSVFGTDDHLGQAASVGLGSG